MASVERDTGGPTLGIVIKTNEGGMWILPQAREALRRGMRVVIMIPEGQGKLSAAADLLASDEPGLSIQRLRFGFSMRPRLATLRGIVELRKALRHHRIDFILYHLYASALAVRLASVGMRLRKIHMVAGPLYLENRVIRWIERILWRLDTEIIAGSDYTRKQYLELGTSPSRLHVCAYGVDLDRFDRRVSASRMNVRGELRIPVDAFVAVMVAYVYAPKSLVFPGVGIKGHELLLDVWREFAAGRRNARLVFVGSGFDAEGERHRHALMHRDSDPSALGSVTWLDSVEDVRSIYAAADLSVSPSLSENHGAALEASAMRVPSIVSDAGGLPEALAPGVGWVFRCGDRASLASCLRDAYDAWESGDLVQLGMVARRKMEREFDVRDSVRRVIDIVVGGGARA